MSVEEHYNRLLTEAEYAEEMAKWPSENSAQDFFDLRDRVAKTATRIAKEDWPRMRAVLAEKGGRLPKNPPVFGDSLLPICVRQYGQTRVRQEYIARRDEFPDYVTEAEAELTPILKREAQAKRERFEQYRQAVIQGVAIDAEEKKE